MRRRVDKLAFLLASSGLSEREIFDLMRDVEKYGPELVTELASEIRKSVKTRFSTIESAEYWNPSSASRSGSSRDKRSRDVAAAMEDLLRYQANLNAADIAAELISSLGEDDFPIGDLPVFRSKDGLRSWFHRLSQRLPSSLLLHHATRIRNRLVHIERGDWPLRKRGS